MNELSEIFLDKELSEAINHAVDEKERIPLYRHGEIVAAIVPIEDLDRLEELEEEEDIKAVKESIKEYDQRIPWDEAKRKLGY